MMMMINKVLPNPGGPPKSWVTQSKDCPLEEPHMGEKWPGPNVPTVLSYWLELPKKTLDLAARL